MTVGQQVYLAEQDILVTVHKTVLRQVPEAKADSEWVMERKSSSLKKGRSSYGEVGVREREREKAQKVRGGVRQQSEFRAGI